MTRSLVRVDVVVVGDGAAGLGAALQAFKSGHAVHVISGGTGASALAPGALDLAPWEDAAGDEAIAPGALSLLSELGLYRVPLEGGVLLATSSGILRPARGADGALLDLSRIARGAVLVPKVEHQSWDATALARSWADTDIARARGLDFVAAPATLLRFREERARLDAEIAERHDDPVRLEWLAERIRDALAKGGPYGAVLLPPWLGVDAPRAEQLSARVGIPCGEAASALASSPGQRFERARDRALAGLTRTRAWVERVVHTAPFWTLSLEGARPVEASAVILAAGGQVGGGIAMSHDLSLRPAIEAPGTFGAHGRPLSHAGSPFGPPPESLAWPFAHDPALERAGLLVDAAYRVRGAPSGLFACGDVAADRARTWLQAWTSGVQAAAALDG